MTEPAEQKNGWTWALGGQALGGVTLASLLAPYSKVITQAAGAPVDAADRKVMRTIKDALRASPEFDARASIVKRLATRRGEGSEAAANFRRSAGLSRDPGGASYNTFTGRVNLSKGQAGPAILAHELGHKAGHPMLLRGGQIGALLSGLAGVGALASSDQDNSRNYALAGTGLAGLNLASEIDASRRGYQMLRAAGSGKARALKAFIGVPTYAAMAGLPMLSHQIKKLMSGFDVDTSKQAADEERSYAAQGALAAALPIGAHLDYELRQLPAHRKSILETVAQAAKEKKIYQVLNPTGPLRDQMQLGDIIQNSNSKYWRDLLKDPRSGNMATVSLIGSGSPFPHVSMSTRSGRGIDMGDSNKLTPHRRLLKSLLHRLGRGENSAPDASGPFRKPTNVNAALNRVGSDVFLTGVNSGISNATVVRRLPGVADLDQKALATSMLEHSEKPYSKLRATLSGLLHLGAPLGHKLPGLDALKGLGTFCSDGVCSILPKGVGVPAGATSLPHMVAGPSNSSLIGIGLNRAAIANATVGLKGSARLQSAALNVLNKNLSNAAGLRRFGAGGLIASVAGLGALAGSLIPATKAPPAS